MVHKKMGTLIVTVIAIVQHLANPTFAQEPFYKSKTIRIAVATSAGGGFDTYTRTADYYRPYVLPPLTSKERVKTLRKVFQDTMKDPEFLADAAKSRLDIDLVTGTELEILSADYSNSARP